MSGNGNWDDDRLAQAYRALAAAPAPRDLADRTVERVRDTGRSPRLFRSARAPARALAGLVGLAAVLAIVVGALNVRSGPVSASPSPASVASGLPLQVLTVSQALAARDRGAFEDPATLVAIGGWLAPTLPALGPFVPSHPPLERDQHSTPYFLTETRQKLVEQGAGASMSWANGTTPSGPSIAPRLLEGGAELPVKGGTQDDYEPVQAVLVGHFHDGRAADCSAEQRAACENEFVLDQVASLDGRALGPSVRIGLNAAGDVRLQPKLSDAEVTALLAPYLSPSDAIVSLAAERLAQLYEMRAAGLASGSGDSVFWLIRVAGPAPRFPMDFRGGDSGWFVVDDERRAVVALGGWGFVPGARARTASRGPVRRYANGDYVIPTTTERDVETACADIGFDAVLHGDPADPRIVWLENRMVAPGADTQMGITIVWPAGYRARFPPKLEIVDDRGDVVFREGDLIEGACATGEDGVFLVRPFR